MEIVLTARGATDSTALNDLKVRGDVDLAYRRISYSSKRSTGESRTNREKKKGVKQFKERSGTANVHLFLHIQSSTLMVVIVNTHKCTYTCSSPLLQLHTQIWRVSSSTPQTKKLRLRFLSNSPTDRATRRARVCPSCRPTIEWLL